MSRFFLCLPVAATILNVLIATAILRNAKADTELPAIRDSSSIPALNEATSFEICLDAGGQECGQAFIVSDDYRKDEVTLVDFRNDNDDTPLMDMTKDPNLRYMEEYDFHAYKRRDVSTFYGEQPGSRTETTPTFKGQAGKFINMSPEPLDLYWDSGKGFPGNFLSSVGPFESSGTATFHGHRFYFAPRHNPNKVLCRFFVVSGTSIYFYDPFSYGNMRDPGACRHNNYRSVDSMNKEDRALYDQHRVNLDFGKTYRKFTGGSEWFSMYPRAPPQHPMWATDFIGQTHYTSSLETQFTSLPERTSTMSWERLSRNKTDIEFPEHRTGSPVMNMTLTVLSCEPKILEVQHFLSDVEADHLLALANAKNLKLSTTGKSDVNKANIKNTRTSYNTWISRYSSPIVDAIYRRVADLVHVDESLLRHRDNRSPVDRRGSNTQPLSEELQLVHYENGQEYTAHHDHSYPDNRDYISPPSRSINVLMYLNEGMVGGETSFPRWRHGEATGDALNVTPQKGKVVIFYMVNPDGNLDDLTQHAALPVTQGEKWLANLWIWDPVKL